MTGRGSRSEPAKSNQRTREPPDRGETSGPPSKRQRALAPAPLHANSVARATASVSSHNSFKKDLAGAADAAADDDEIQEVAPTIVKSEPRDASSVVTVTAMAAAAADDDVAGAGTSEADYGDSDSQAHGGEVALEDSYQDESYDYGGGDYGDVSFGGDDGSGHVIDPTTGLPLGAGASDGNKGRMRFYTWNIKIFIKINARNWQIFVTYAVLRRRHFYGRLRFHKYEVPELTPAPTKLVRLRLQAKKVAPAPYTKTFHVELLVS